VVEAATASTNLTPTNLAGNRFTLGVAGSGGANLNRNDPVGGASGLRIEYSKR
jgi:hypothetical protein